MTQGKRIKEYTETRRFPRYSPPRPDNEPRHRETQKKEREKEVVRS